ncbi:TPA: hypothetical protein U0928_000252 [Streptococcus suis 11538]|uniref:YopX family protein n=1 Tax=Streptococcus suis TaxID=1307 RepID=UPI000405B5CD|nr:YopX family protein [Streptococcus suis]HEL2310505.1 hypothetical protein [Streptococcus suis]HEL2620147.1 hypothetical protein [Streptococcus suis]HEL2654318.1 hypothetical protein [Streptococcus suis]HEM2587614.1 hypothetical protein [Streptococcus suis]HEM2715320.1 hypothetical protein [Streptococcus suis]
MISKFRVWEPYYKKMFTNDKIIIWNGNVYVNDADKITVDNMRGWSIDDKYLMQSTGLIDVNGKEIFEGDVVLQNKWRKVAVSFGTQEVEENFGDKRIFQGFNLYLGGGYPEAVMCELEIIGNIYEHPELMEDL